MVISNFIAEYLQRQVIGAAKNFVPEPLKDLLSSLQRKVDTTKDTRSQDRSPFASLIQSAGLRPELDEANEANEQVRSTFFGEIWESILTRSFPNIAKLMDLATNLGPLRTDTEVVPWQNEFETITALSLFVPDFLLKPFTDPFLNSEVFLKIVKNYPTLGEKWYQKISKEKDPDDIINALRIIHQDIFITGKLSIGKLLDLVLKNHD